MSHHDQPDDPTNRNPNRSRGAIPATTRRGLLKLSSAFLLVTSLLGGVSGIARAVPAPGAVNWSSYIENPRVYAENAVPRRELPYSESAIPDIDTT